MRATGIVGWLLLLEVAGAGELTLFTASTNTAVGVAMPAFDAQFDHCEFRPGSERRWYVPTNLNWGAAVGGFEMAVELEARSGQVFCWVRNGTTNEIVDTGTTLGERRWVTVDLLVTGQWVRLPRIPVSDGHYASGGFFRPRPVAAGKVIAPSPYASYRADKWPAFMVDLLQLDWPMAVFQEAQVSIRVVQGSLSSKAHEVYSPTLTIPVTWLKAWGAEVGAEDGLGWGEPKGGLQLAAQNDPAVGVLHCWLRNTAPTNVLCDAYWLGQPETTHVEVAGEDAAKELFWSGLDHERRAVISSKAGETKPGGWIWPLRWSVLGGYFDPPYRRCASKPFLPDGFLVEGAGKRALRPNGYWIVTGPRWDLPRPKPKRGAFLVDWLDFPWTPAMLAQPELKVRVVQEVVGCDGPSSRVSSGWVVIPTDRLRTLLHTLEHPDPFHWSPTAFPSR